MEPRGRSKHDEKADKEGAWAQIVKLEADRTRLLDRRPTGMCGSATATRDAPPRDPAKAKPKAAPASQATRAAPASSLEERIAPCLTSNHNETMVRDRG